MGWLGLQYCYGLRVSLRELRPQRARSSRLQCAKLSDFVYHLLRTRAQLVYSTTYKVQISPYSTERRRALVHAPRQRQWRRPGSRNGVVHCLCHWTVTRSDRVPLPFAATTDQQTMSVNTAVGAAPVWRKRAVSLDVVATRAPNSQTNCPSSGQTHELGARAHLCVRLEPRHTPLGAVGARPARVRKIRPASET